MKKTLPRTVAVKKKTKVYVFLVEKKYTLLSSLLALMPHKSRNLLKAVLRDGQVSIDGNPVTQFNYILKPGQLIEVRWDKKTPQQQPHDLNIDYF